MRCSVCNDGPDHSVIFVPLGYTSLIHCDNYINVCKSSKVYIKKLILASRPSAVRQRAQVNDTQEICHGRILFPLLNHFIPALLSLLYIKPLHLFNKSTSTSLPTRCAFH